jgi:phage terminase large subunit
MVATKTKPDIWVSIDPRVFNDIYRPYLDNSSRLQINYGGASSGKSKFKAQQVIYDLLNGGRNYLVCRKIAKDSRYSTFVEVKRIIDEWNVGELFSVNESNMVITCQNGYQAVFKGLDDLEKIKSITFPKGVLTDIWIEESTQAAWDDLKQLKKRQRGGDEQIRKRIHLTFNPILQDHWIFKEFFAPLGWTEEQTEYNSDELSILKTWYIHNRFLTEQDINDLLGETDKYYRDVYTYGNWGVLGNVIFNNWEIRDLSGMQDQFTNRRNGGDFGFSNDPAAFGRTHYDRKRKEIYVFDGFYQSGLTNDLLAKEVMGMIGNERIVWDSAEPKSIQELRNYGVNAIGARKGKDSVLHGIQWLQQHKIIVDKTLVNEQGELRQYKWKEDKNGNPIPQPIDYNNHFIDWLRYAYEDDMIVVEINTNATVTNYIRGKQEQETRPGFR